MLEHSPLLVDADLVDAVATGGRETQAAIARRADLPCSVAAAIAEVGSAEACLVLIENPSAEIVPFSLDRIVARYRPSRRRSARRCSPATICRRRRARRWLPSFRETLAGFVTSRDWLDEDRAQRVAKEACEKATVTLAAVSPEDEIRPLIRHLRESGQLNAGLVLRALLSGNIDMFEEALAELSGMPLGARERARARPRRSPASARCSTRPDLPASTYPAFREAVEAMREGGFVGDPGGAERLKRRMVERVLTRCADEIRVDIEPLLTLLRRFAAEAAREEARMFCEELVADDHVELEYRPEYEPEYEQQRAA